MAEYTLRQLEYFVAVAEAGSVTGAAERVHLSQSAMSAALADLEQALDVQLLLRHHARGVTLTAAGEQLLVATRRLLSQADDLKHEALSLGHRLSGSLTIGCFGVLAPYVLPDLLATCAERYPELRLNTQEVDLDALAEGVLAGRFELGLGYQLVPNPRLAVESVFSLPPYALLPADHELAGRRRISLAQLAGEPLALLDLPHSRDYFRAMFAAAGVEPNVRYQSRNVETLRALVGRGLAYTLLNLKPAVATSLDGHPVASVPLEGGAPLEVVLVTAAGGRPTRRAAAVAAICAEVLRRRGAEHVTREE
ncbi:LysR family transcriptional regulator [Actinospica sp. MGRD01-02]|uniref:LysR family transcriptional regulator n=1 Tax=Actinospica acidithermotolerans TaxID=2828514 RepID=A0A941IHA3_9ACTN|nr:LysR family transcriptional regulator [Actinospica acidithermotolerans]MBR7826994.1 LysR family transcriptional regulator [Actinospica acidithermotolerans]